MIPTRRVLGAALALVLLTVTKATATVTLDFDEVSAGTVLNEAYQDQGVRLEGIGGMGPYDIVAAEPCLAALSAPNHVSLRPAGQCPEITDANGWFRATFTLSQPRVSVRVTIGGPGAATYLRAYHKGGFLEWTFGETGEQWVGVPQVLEIVQPPDQKQIDYVEFGAFAQGDVASFDDLSFERSGVAVQETSWGTLKARFR